MKCNYKEFLLRSNEKRIFNKYHHKFPIAFQSCGIHSLNAVILQSICKFRIDWNLDINSRRKNTPTYLNINNRKYNNEKSYELESRSQMKNHTKRWMKKIHIQWKNILKERIKSIFVRSAPCAVFFLYSTELLTTFNLYPQPQPQLPLAHKLP